jgi:hypothetical protein
VLEGELMSASELGHIMHIMYAAVHRCVCVCVCVCVVCVWVCVWFVSVLALVARMGR